MNDNEYKTILRYIDNNAVAVSNSQSRDLSIARTLNENLEIIDNEHYIDVEMVIKGRKITQLFFYVKDEYTSDFSDASRPIYIKYLGKNGEKGIFESLFITQFDGSVLSIQCSKSAEKIIVAKYDEGVLLGRYLEFDTYGVLRVLGNYSQENAFFTEIITEYNPNTFEERQVKKEFSKKSRKSGRWKFYDIYGNLEKEKVY